MSGLEAVLALWGAIASAFAINFYTKLIRAESVLDAAKHAFYQVVTDDNVRDHARKVFLKEGA